MSDDQNKTSCRATQAMKLMDGHDKVMPFWTQHTNIGQALISYSWQEWNPILQDVHSVRGVVLEEFFFFQLGCKPPPSTL